ncbi:MAG: endonuclease/exonuclease/phosphatase [Terrimonas sp.]|nr:endonuclease/exonuclease/phosphatase [Terrimonas sp.]
MLLFLIYWVFQKNKVKILVTFVIILCCWKNIQAVISIGGGEGSKAMKQKNTVRVLTWNVMRMGEIDAYTEERKQVRYKAMNEISLQDADILCLQEFHHATGPNYFSNIPFITDTLGFPYFYYSRDFEAFGGLYMQGTIIFSKFPIVDSGKIQFQAPTFPESLIYADIKVGKDTVRVYTTHLQSFSFAQEDYQEMQRLNVSNDSNSSSRKRLFNKIKHAIINRSLQAGWVRQATDKSPYPKILCGDFNDVPGSYTYFKIKGGMKDAFLEKGWGLGRTFSRISPTLRIDYLFHDPGIIVKQVYRMKQELSDHFGLVTDLQIGN